MKDFILTFLAVAGFLILFIVMPVLVIVIGSMGYTLISIVLGFFTFCGIVTVVILY